VRLALDEASPGALVVVSGSLYLVGEVKRILAG
jgi:folylpolyglutamate synthase/dihydropteroate synthase